jgi:hypothetical protein
MEKTVRLRHVRIAALWPEESAQIETQLICHDHVEPMQWLYLNVFNKECMNCCRPAARPAWQRQQGVWCDPAVGWTQQALHLVESLGIAFINLLASC